LDSIRPKREEFYYHIRDASTAAGLGTFIHMKPNNGPKEASLLFDIGSVSLEASAVSHVFLTHGHLDHVNAIFMHARIRCRSKDLPVPKYYMNPLLIPPLLKAKGAFEELNDNSEIPMEFVPLYPGKEVYIGGDCFVSPFPTVHRVASQGYLVRWKKSNGLLPEFQNLSGKEIGELKRSGTIVNTSSISTEVVYTGDTIFKALLEIDEIWSAKIMIIEVTYLIGPSENAEKWGHIHIDSLVENADCFDNVKQLIICHVSVKYSIEEILGTLREKLPPKLRSKTGVMLKKFGMEDAVTYL